MAYAPREYRLSVIPMELESGPLYDDTKPALYVETHTHKDLLRKYGLGEDIDGKISNELLRRAQILCESYQGRCVIEQRFTINQDWDHLMSTCAFT